MNNEDIIQTQHQIQPVKNKGGRPPKLKINDIIAVASEIAKGVPHEKACSMHGVAIRTWNKASKSPEFSQTVKKYEGQFISMALDAIAAGQKNWQGYAWILERRHAADFGRREIPPSVESEEKRKISHTERLRIFKELLGISEPAPKEIHAEVISTKVSDDKP